MRPKIIVAALLTFMVLDWAASREGVAFAAGGRPLAESALQPNTNKIVGSASCKECHENFHQLWATSHHGLAMQRYETAKTNLTPCVDPLKIGRETYGIDIAAGIVTQSGPGAVESFRIEQALGGKDIYYFLTPFAKGRLQVLPLAYDIRRKEWFDVAASAVRHFGTRSEEAYSWRDRAYTFNTACFNCHVSQLTNNYDLANDAYVTSWIEPGINCETCHGPGAEHIRVARQAPAGQPIKELKLITTKDFSAEQVNSMCGSCHSRMISLTGSFVPGDHFFDQFSLEGLEQTDFYPDGRDLGENFTYTTWRLSPCLKSDKLTCVTCHTSSGRYRFADKQANSACLPCHESIVSAAGAHSHHATGSAGSACVACHMPTTEFARIRRSDHSMRPPSPAATLAFGSPNACNLCHTNHDAGWADQVVRQWYKSDYQAPFLRQGRMIAAARKQDWSKLPEMIGYLTNRDRAEIWSAGLLHLIRGCDNDAKWPAVLACVEDGSPLVRAAAIEALGDSGRPEFSQRLVSATRDRYRLVRVRAAAALEDSGREKMTADDRKSIDAATEEMLASFRAHPDDPASYHNLGNYYLGRGEINKAISSFDAALGLSPSNVASLVNLALAYNLKGENAKAEAHFRRVLAIDPTNAVANLNLGMLLAEMAKLPEAEKAFRAAFKADSKSAQAAYNLAVLLATDRPEESLTWARRAGQLAPANPKYAYTLAFYLRQRGQLDEAAQTLETLTHSSDAPADAFMLLGRIYEGQRKRADALTVYRRGSENSRFAENVRRQFLDLIRALSDR